MQKQDTGIIVVIILAIVGILFVTGNIPGLERFAIGYELVYKADWGHICCKEGAYQPPFTRYIDDYSLYKCDAYTDECVVSMHPAEKLGIAARSFYFQICDINGQNCGDKDYMRWGGYSPPSEVEVRTLQYGQSILFSPTGWPNQKDWEYFVFDAKYRKFYIEGSENDKIYVQATCILNAELRERVLAGGLNELSKFGGEPNNCQNYIIGYIETFTQTYDYLGEKVVCQSRDIYEIDTVNFLDGSTDKIQGERIKSVTCCPHEANCDDDFEWGEVVIKDCPLGYNYECPNAGEPVMETGTTYVKWECVNNMCVKSGPITVECTNDAVCVDKMNNPNAVCINFECESNGEEWVGVCGDGVCESVIGETQTSCPEDCGEAVDRINLIGAKKLSLTKDEISKATSQELLAHACLTSSECLVSVEEAEDYKASCINIARLREDGVLTKADSDNFFNNAQKIAKGATYGAAAGVTGCIVVGAVIATAFPVLMPALLGCGAVGALIGGVATDIILDFTQDDNLLDALHADGTDCCRPHDAQIYYTASPQLADDVQELAFLCGFETAKWGPYKNDGIGMYQVHI
ncbi:hypothetical protein LCGC14_2069170, partial [marine sediment metagenome]